MHFTPTETLGAGTSVSQLGQIFVVARNIYAAIWFNTCPLNGIGLGRITSKAEMRSDATITSHLFEMVYTSLTFPL
jgi:hypothetical protein